MKTINWGMIGCGDVTEVKSGPAFNKVPNSSLVAVMRRDATKAQDYAQRHQVPKWYSDADQLINDPHVNAIYVATPPSTHETYTLAALRAGKPVYVEKPMSTNGTSAAKMAAMAQEKNIKLVVAHYRRQQPFYIKIKQLIQEKAIGEVRFAKIEFCRKQVSDKEMADPSRAWRVNADIAGGGLFHDLAPHQLDIMYHFFGEIRQAAGMSINQTHSYSADELISGNILFKSGVLFQGLWCFNVANGLEKDICEIIGSEGKISFSFFDRRPILLTQHGKIESLEFDPLPHVQQPMIEQVVNYFLDQAPNPCDGNEGALVMKLIDNFTKHN